MTPCKRLITACLLVAVATLVPPAFGDDDVRNKLESLSAEQLDQLRRSQQRFAKMSPQEQQRIRELHQRLSKHQQSQQLSQVMEKYSAWLGSLSAGKRAELLALSGKERLEKMREIILRQERERFVRLAASEFKQEDREALFRWIGKLALARRDTLLKVMPEPLRERFGEADEKWQARMLNMTLYAHPENLKVQPQEIEQLLETLSDSGRRALDKVGTLDKKAALISDWIGIMRSSSMRRPVKPVSEAKLTEFYNKLDDRRQDYLRSLPTERMKRELESMYHLSNRGWGGRGGPRGSGGSRGGPGGGVGGGRAGFGGRQSEGPGKPF